MGSYILLLIKDYHVLSLYRGRFKYLDHLWHPFSPWYVCTTLIAQLFWYIEYRWSRISSLVLVWSYVVMPNRYSYCTLSRILGASMCFTLGCSIAGQLFFIPLQRLVSDIELLSRGYQCIPDIRRHVHGLQLSVVSLFVYSPLLWSPTLTHSPKRIRAPVACKWL